MMLARKGMDIPDYCYHRPEIKDYHGETITEKLI